MLREGHLALLLDELLRLHPVVEVELHFLEPLKHAFFVIDGFQAELLLQVFLLVQFSLSNLLVTVDGDVIVALLDHSLLLLTL